MKLVFATSNEHKLTEIRKMMSQSYELLNLIDIGCTVEIPETGNTLEENAEQKARYVLENYHCNCFADDSGLEIEALDNRPGVHSARYAGDQKKSDDNIRKILIELKNKTNRTARFRTVICLMMNGKTIFFEGAIKGKIINGLRGKNGFGYDPVFIPDGYGKTFAEMSDNEKNKISHRAIAVKKLITYFN